MSSISHTSNSPSTYGAKDVREMMMSFSDASLQRFGGVDGFLRRLDVQDIARGISSTSIGQRIEKFGDGDLKFRQNPKIAAALFEYYSTHPDGEPASWIVGSGDDENFKDHFRRMADQFQNECEYEVIRDGTIRRVLGCQLVVGDIIKLSDAQLLCPEDIVENDVLSRSTKKHQQETKPSIANNNDNCNHHNRNRDDNDDHQTDDDEHAKNARIEQRRQNEERERLRRRSRRAQPTFIPADCLVLEGRIVQDHSALTGEVTNDASTPTRHPQLLCGAKIVDGESFALVVLVGKSTVFGSYLFDDIVDRVNSSRQTKFGCRCGIQ